MNTLKFLLATTLVLVLSLSACNTETTTDTTEPVDVLTTPVDVEDTMTDEEEEIPEYTAPTHLPGEEPPASEDDEEESVEETEA